MLLLSNQDNHIDILYLTILIINIFLYGGTCILILKRRSYTCISMRSPSLLLFNNIFNFFCSTIVILTHILSGKVLNIITGFYFVFQCSMIVALFLRCHRIAACYQMQKDERLDLKQFYNKRYIYQEIFYVKVLGISFLIFTLLFLLLGLTSYKGFKTLYTYNFIQGPEENGDDYNEHIKREVIIFLIISFLECLVVFFYSFLMIIKGVGQKLKLELTSISVILFLYMNLSIEMSIVYSKDNEIRDIMNIITLVVYYLFLFMNGGLPLITSFYYFTSISFHFSPKLMNSLYLFLTNEPCYKAFSDFLKEGKGHDKEDYYYYLTVYTHIMKFKLSVYLKEDEEYLLQTARQIYDVYFNLNHKGKMDTGICTKIKENCIELDSGKFNKDSFDDALKFLYLKLGDKFIEFRKTKAFAELNEAISLSSYIHCKMYNTGMINK